jgi:hypothetical protein
MGDTGSGSGIATGASAVATWQVRDVWRVDLADEAKA